MQRRRDPPKRGTPTKARRTPTRPRAACRNILSPWCGVASAPVRAKQTPVAPPCTAGIMAQPALTNSVLPVIPLPAGQGREWDISRCDCNRGPLVPSTVSKGLEHQTADGGGNRTLWEARDTNLQQERLQKMRRTDEPEIVLPAGRGWERNSHGIGCSSRTLGTISVPGELQHSRQRQGRSCKPAELDSLRPLWLG